MKSRIVVTVVVLLVSLTMAGCAFELSVVTLALANLVLNSFGTHPFRFSFFAMRERRPVSPGRPARCLQARWRAWTQHQRLVA